MSLTNGTRVWWWSHTGKKRTGKYITDMAAQHGYSMVLGSWDGKLHILKKERLEIIKKGEKEE